MNLISVGIFTLGGFILILGGITGQAYLELADIAGSAYKKGALKSSK